MKKLFCLLTIFSLAILPVVGCGDKPKEKDAAKDGAKKEADGAKKEADGAKKEADAAKKEADAK